MQSSSTSPGGNAAATRHDSGNRAALACLFHRSIPLLLTLLSAVVVGCHKEAPAARKPSGGPTAVTVAPVKLVAWDQTVPIVGTLYPKDEATLGAQVEGTVERTTVEFGDRVKADQVLAYIDTASYLALQQQAEGVLARAQAALPSAQHHFQRISELRKTGVASESDLDGAKAALGQAEAEVKAAEGSLAVAKLNLARSEVRAPFDAAVSRRIVNRGDFMKIGSPLFEVVNDAILKFIFQVPERYASQVTKRLPVSFSVDNYPGETFTGNVYLISPLVAGPSRAFNVGALVTNTNFRLKASTYARGSITLQTAVPTPSVPLESVVQFAGLTKVYVVEGSVARARTVRTGRSRDGVQEILEGLAAGESVVVTGQGRLHEGSPVVVKTGEPPANTSKSPSTRGAH